MLPSSVYIGSTAYCLTYFLYGNVPTDKHMYSLHVNTDEIRFPFSSSLNLCGVKRGMIADYY